MITAATDQLTRDIVKPNFFLLVNFNSDPPLLVFELLQKFQSFIQILH